ncbi:MAG: hypothetical protein AAB486_02815 [Patescibacteria group bacterium]
MKVLDYAATAEQRFAKSGFEGKKRLLRVIGSNMFLKDRSLAI